MNADKPLVWSDLYPWLAYGPEEEERLAPMWGADVYELVIDGVTWVTDRRILVRRDLIAGSKPYWVFSSPASKSTAEKMRELLAGEGKPREREISPHYLDMAERLGAEITPDGETWRFHKGGELVAVVAGLRRTEHDEPYMYALLGTPLLPGLDLKKARQIKQFMPNYMPTGEAWIRSLAVAVYLEEENTND